MRQSLGGQQTPQLSIARSIRLSQESEENPIRADVYVGAGRKV